jgi:hypothetical protein
MDFLYALNNILDTLHEFPHNAFGGCCVIGEKIEILRFEWVYVGGKATAPIFPGIALLSTPDTLFLPRSKIPRDPKNVSQASLLDVILFYNESSSIEYEGHVIFKANPLFERLRGRVPSMIIDHQAYNERFANLFKCSVFPPPEPKFTAVGVLEWVIGGSRSKNQTLHVIDTLVVYYKLWNKLVVGRVSKEMHDLCYNAWLNGEIDDATANRLEKLSMRNQSNRTYIEPFVELMYQLLDQVSHME